MLKNNKGVTITMLAITVVVILIITGVTISTSDLLIRDTKSKSNISNMYLIRAKTETIYDDYLFSEDSNVLIGSKVNVSTLADYSITQEETTGNAKEFWYEIDYLDLPSLGMDENVLSNGGKFIVNYETGEVIYTNGIEDNDGTIKYKLSEF